MYENGYNEARERFARKVEYSETERDAMLAALRLLQPRLADLEATDPELFELATCGGEHALITAAEVSDLCERLNQ